jgi:hypothetical protein
MASKKVTAALAALTEAFEGFVEAVAQEAGNAADIAEAMPSKKGKKPADEDDDDDEKEVDPAAKKKALKQLAALDLDEADRPTMKPIADALGIDVQGKKTTEVRAALAEALKGGGKTSKSKADDDDDDDDDEKPAKKPAKKKPAADDDEDDDDEKPKAKGKKKPADDDDEEDDSEVEYPDAKTMKKEVRIFTKANKKGILKRDPEFFDDSEDGDEDMLRLHQILGDEDELKKCWKDNIAALHENGDKAWKKTVKAAEAADE